MKIHKKLLSDIEIKKIIGKNILIEILEEIKLKELQKEADILNKIPEDRMVREYDDRMYR